MSTKRKKAFEELQKHVEEYSGEVGNIFEVLEEYLKKVETYPKSHDIHDLLAQIESIAGMLLADTKEAENLLKDIELVLDDQKKTSAKVKELFKLLEEGPKMLAGIEALEEDVKDILGE